jgi:hypothetical protein
MPNVVGRIFEKKLWLISNQTIAGRKPREAGTAPERKFLDRSI